MKSVVLSSLLFFIGVAACIAATKVEIGVTGLSAPEIVVTPNSGKNLPANSPAPVLVEPAGKTVPAPPSVTDLKDRKHLQQPAENHAQKIPAAATFPKTAGTGQASEVEQAGKGSSEFEAFADGTAQIIAFLPTYRPARIIVRLLGGDGEEIYFKGKSLLVWERPDDKAYAPVFFKGSSDESSMKKVSSGNYDAVQNKYSFEIEQGQRLQLEIEGQPEASSYIKAFGPIQ